MTMQILKWVGGKKGLLKDLIPHLNIPHKRYIEPFLGGGAVFQALKSQSAILADKNEELICTYTAIRDTPHAVADLLDICAESHSEEFYYRMRSTTPQTAAEVAARMVYLNRAGFRGLYRQNRQGKFNVPFGHSKICPKLYDINTFHEWGALLQNVLLQTADFGEILELAGSEDLVYCDPPYLPLSQTANFTAYLTSGFGISEHIRLRDACVSARARGAQVVVSNHDVPLIREMYAGYSIHKIVAPRRVGGQKTADEVVIIL